MYKIEFIPTGHSFLLPDETAKELKEKFPNDYKILEKNGKKFRDRAFPKKVTKDTKYIRDLVIDETNYKRR